ncbi:reverse transcriptase-like protein [Terrilactibacillus sp. BCM23-1]|uniref:Reverse transcriptase-like protein n=1 Tax=Terrilactibacillus tamarindi TaxID=2599694 RepID=A0A6N8CQB2_9BACI|nr:ribonuclease H family protein [Terrilactibacillus tamarindi]MTT31125.1 reverse transcriptase-like protein [Terrilactibacillus tamarindi]
MNVRIETTYKTKKGTETTFSSVEMPAEKALLIAEDLEKTGRIKNLTFIDSNESTWTAKELKKYLQGIQTEPHHVTAYFDGGFDLETKKSGLGCVIYYEQNGKRYRLRRNALVSYLDTNNEAEYAALHLVLKELEKLGVHHLPVKFVGDSLVVINQLSGEWPVYEEELNKWADRIDDKLEQLGITPEYELVPRKNNQEADQLASQALREIEITGTIELDGENNVD